MNGIAQLRELTWSLVPSAAVRIYRELSPEISAYWEKNSYAKGLDQLGSLIKLWPGEGPSGIPGSPGPLAGTLVGGMAGAGLGYGLGTLGSKLLPEKWRSRRLRTLMTLLGGAIGAAPGVTYGLANLLDNKSFNDTSLLGERGYNVGEVDAARRSVGLLGNAVQQPKSAGDGHAKESVEGAFSSQTGLFAKPIDVNAFNQIIWNDPYVAGPLRASTQAAASGLLTGAANLPGKLQNKFVTPMDVGRMAAGMGAGYLSGALVGKALGLMMGMPPDTQQKLRQTGMWAGLVKSLVPIAFGG